MNPSTVFTMAGMIGFGILGLFVASRAVDPGMQVFGLTLAGLAVLFTFWSINRLFQPEVTASEQSD